MRNEIIQMMTEEEKTMLFQSMSAAVTLQGVLCEYDVDLAYNILQGGNLESYDEELKVVETKIKELEPIVKAFTKLILNK